MTNLSSSTNTLVRLGLVVLVIFTLARFSVDSLVLPLLGRSAFNGGDFQQYYTAAYTLRVHKNFYDIVQVNQASRDLQGLKQRNSGYIYPPLIALAVVPLTYLPFESASRMWVIVQQIALVIAVLLLARLLPGLAGVALPAVVLLVGNFFPLYFNMVLGQVNVLILLILIAGLWFYRREQFVWAGVCIAVGAMLKISPVLIVGLFVLQHQWPAFLGFVVAALILLLLFVSLIGVETTTSFVTYTLFQTIPDKIMLMSNASLASALARLTTQFNVPALERPLWYAAVAAILGVLVLVSYKKRTAASINFSLLYSTWSVAALLVAPIMWDHHLVVLLLPLALLLPALTTLGSRRHFLTLAIGYGFVYLFAAFPNLAFERTDQWDFGAGWWLLTRNYLQWNLFADLRLIAALGTFVLLIVILRQHDSTLRADSTA